MGGISILAPIETSIGKVTGKQLNVIGKVLDKAGLDSIGNEVQNWGQDILQIGKVASGEYHKDMKEADDKRIAIQLAQNSAESKIKELVDKMDGLIAFHEIFQMAYANKIEGVSKEEQEKIDALIGEYKNLMAQIRNEYDFVIGMAEGSFFEKIISAFIFIIGGLTNDVNDILTGKADSKAWKNIISTIIAVIVIIILIFFGPAGWVGIVAIVLSAISTILMLDSMYANGTLMSAVMSSLDFLFNDILNLDDTVGSDFNKFDSDHEDYAQMVMYIRTSVTIAAVIFSFNAMSGVDIGSALGLSAQTAQVTGALSQMYAAYSAYAAVNDVVNANKAYNALKDELQAKKDQIDQAIASKYSKNFMKHYKDSEYFLNDQQEVVDNYIWSMLAVNMYVDPYGTTPVANSRFAPDDDTRVMNFGFEDMFDYDKMAGGPRYVNNILFKL